MTDLWVRLCTFLLLLLENEVGPFSKGEKEERDLKIRDSRRTYGLRANEERKRDREEERSCENGRVNDQGGLLDRGEPSREPSKSEKEERNLKIGDNRCSCGFEVRKERKGDEKGRRWRKKGRVNDQSPLVDENESSREPSKRHGKGKIEEVDLKIEENKCSGGFEVNQESKGCETGGCWLEKGRMNDQSPLADGNESSREPAKRHGSGKIEEREIRKKSGKT